MRFFLDTFVGDGGSENPFRPATADGNYGIIDLRGVVTVPDGVCLVGAEGVSGRPLLDFGDTLDQRLNNSQVRALANRLGLTLDQTDLRAVIGELLLLHGREDGTRWRRLKQSRDGRQRIFLGGQSVYDAPAIVGTTLTESFNQIDSTTLGPDLTWTETIGDLQTTGNRVRLTEVGAHAARAESDLASTDHYARAKVYATPSDTKWHIAGTRVRYASAADTSYLGYVSDSTTGSNQTSRIMKVVTGSQTVLSETTSRGQGWWTDGDTLRLTVDGSNLTLAIVGGSTLETVTDTAITAGVRAGIYVYMSGGSALAAQELDDFAAADLAGGTDDETGLHSWRERWARIAGFARRYD